MERNLNVLFDTIIYSLQSKGGISRMFSELIPRMKKLDSSLDISYLVTSILIQPLPDLGTSQIYDISYLEEFLRPRRFWENSYPKIKNFFTKNLTHPSRESIFHSTYFTDIDGWKGKKVVSVYDMAYEKFPNLFTSNYDKKFRYLKKKAILNADFILCISESTKVDLIEEYRIGNENVDVAYLGNSPAFIHIESKDIPSDHIVKAPFILYVGKRTHNKNFRELFEAFSRWNRNNEVKLFVVGDAWNFEETSSIYRYHLEEKILLFEKVDDNQLCYLYNQAIAFIYPSLYEGFGLPLLEAMSCGCPIIASNIPSTKEIALDIPFYFQIGEIDSLINSLNLVSNGDEFSTRKFNGFDRVREFSWDDSAKKIITTYKSLY